jgi:hypothetical protein
MPTSEASVPPEKVEVAAPIDEAARKGLAELKTEIETLNEDYLNTRATAEKLAKTKISGYVQAQWQYAEELGQKSFAGGNFAKHSQERFMVRRSRLKVQHSGENAKYVVQFEALPKGVSIKEAYGVAQDPWLKIASVTMGVFNRPFGFEIPFSSSAIESPERARMFQVLFKGEQDLGAQLEIAPDESRYGALSQINLQVAAFAGNGIADETDNEKQYMGRLSFTLPFFDLNMSLDGGASISMGTLNNPAGTVYEWDGDAMGSESANEVDRMLIGLDAQFSYVLPFLGGLSLRGETVFGQWAGTLKSADLYVLNSDAPAEVALRNTIGWTVMAVQNVGQSNQAVFKYDIFDPNSDVGGDDIGLAGNGLNSADIAYQTFGLGLIHHWSGNMKFTAYYDIVQNEKTFLSGFEEDLNDNVFTFRMQAKF